MEKKNIMVGRHQELALLMQNMISILLVSTKVLVKNN